MPAYGYEFYVLVFNSISYSFAALTHEISSWPLKDKIHIHVRACNILYVFYVEYQQHNYLSLFKFTRNFFYRIVNIIFL